MPNGENQQDRRWTRDYVFDILRELEIRYIFGVPGTNEIPIIDGCSYEENDVTYIECLHENIATGAAMGYARMTGKPGVIVVHVTPGIGHCLGNLFNAWKSRIPLVILCCQQQNELVTQEPLLASNLVQLASQYTKWSHELRAWQEIPLVLQRAFKEAMAAPAGPVFISLPWDFTIREIKPDDKIRGVTRIAPRFIGDPAAVKNAADLLSAAQSPVIIAGDGVGYSGAWTELQELAELLGAPVLLQGFSSLVNFPNSDYHWQGELPGAQKSIQTLLEKHDVAFLCGFGAQAQLAVYKYSDGPLIPTKVRQIYLNNDSWEIGKNAYGEAAILGDIKATLPELNALIGQNPSPGAAERNKALQQKAEKRRVEWQQYLQKAKQQEKIWAVVVADALRELIQEYQLEKKFVYVHEAVSDPAPFQFLLPFHEPYAGPASYYCVCGGSLGWSMPATLGIKLAAQGYEDVKPELVINAVGDGSSLFYPQTYWTAAHHQLPILYIIMNNMEYHTLQLGLGQVVAAYGDSEGYRWKPKTMSPEYLTIVNPNFDFVSVAKAFGVHDGRIVESPGDVKDALREALEIVLTKGQSYVIDMRIEQQTPAPPAAMRATAAKVEAPATQPPLNVFYQDELADADEQLTMAPVIF